MYDLLLDKLCFNPIWEYMRPATAQARAGRPMHREMMALDGITEIFISKYNGTNESINTVRFKRGDLLLKAYTLSSPYGRHFEVEWIDYAKD